MMIIFNILKLQNFYYLTVLIFAVFTLKFLYNNHTYNYFEMPKSKHNEPSNPYTQFDSSYS